MEFELECSEDSNSTGTCSWVVGLLNFALILGKPGKL